MPLPDSLQSNIDRSRGKKHSFSRPASCEHVLAMIARGKNGLLPLGKEHKGNPQQNNVGHMHETAQHAVHGSYSKAQVPRQARGDRLPGFQELPSMVERQTMRVNYSK